MINKIQPKTIKLDLTKSDLQSSLTEILNAIATIKVTAKRLLVELPSIELTFKK